MLETSTPEGINPWMVALLMTVATVRPKSSAVSVSGLLLAGAESDPSLPSGFPVLKRNISAIAGAAAARPTESAAADAIVMYVLIKALPAFRWLTLCVKFNQFNIPFGQDSRKVKILLK